jgi:MFS transporter, UMF2 family, putative MFS family transporter protein
MSALSSATEPALPRAIDRPLAVLALILVATVTESMFMILPSFVGALGDVLHLPAERLGLLGSADLAGIAISTATAAWWLRRVSWRRSIALSLGAFFVVNVLCIGVRSFEGLLALRLLAGVCAGAAYAVALAGLIDTRKVDRNTGLMVCSQVVLAALGVYATDVVPMAWRLDAVYIYILAWLVPTLLVSWRYFPQDPDDRPATVAIDWRRLAGPGSAAVLGSGLYFLMIGAVWGYLEGVARSAGLSLEQTGEALSLGLVVSLVGSVAATLLGVKFGRAGPLIVTGVFQAGSLYLLTRLGGYASPVLAFYVINAVFQVFWSYVIAYFIIIFNDIDPSGRFVAFYGTSSHLTLAVGPYVGAILIAGGSYVPLLWFGVITVVLCYVSFLTAVGATRAAPGAVEIRA